MREITNDFSWSKSRHEKFSDCRRSYYLHYYGSWGGWKDSASADLKQLFVLKKLSNRFNWAGNVVHAAIRDVLLDVRADRPIDEVRVLGKVHATMREDFRHSRGKGYWENRRRQDFMGLMEHEYDEPVGPEEWKRNWDNVAQALGWFFRSRWLEEARRLKPHQWLEVDEGADKSWFDMDGVKVYAIPDFAYVDDRGRTTVVDWKTGKPREGYEDQVVGYALYLAHRYRVPPEDVQCRLVFLNSGDEVHVPVDPETVERFRAHFEASVRQMQGLLVNAAQNVPLDAAEFPQTEDLSQCARCAFRRACRRERVSFHALLPRTPAQAGGPSASAA